MIYLIISKCTSQLKDTRKMLMYNGKAVHVSIIDIKKTGKTIARDESNTSLMESITFQPHENLAIT